MKRRIDAHVVMEKLVPRITEEYRKIYDIPENHESMAIFSADCEDVMWLAVDDATKKAKIKVIQIETVYGGVVIRGADMAERLRRLFPARKLQM